MAQDSVFLATRSDLRASSTVDLRSDSRPPFDAGKNTGYSRLRVQKCRIHCRVAAKDVFHLYDVIYHHRCHVLIQVKMMIMYDVIKVKYIL